MPPSLAVVIDCSKPNRFRGGGQGVLLRRLRDKAFRVVYCCLISHQVHRIACRLHQLVPLNYPYMTGGCLLPAVARRGRKPPNSTPPHCSNNI
jgi:hypothetical protein